MAVQLINNGETAFSIRTKINENCAYLDKISNEAIIPTSLPYGKIYISPTGVLYTGDENNIAIKSTQSNDISLEQTTDVGDILTTSRMDIPAKYLQCNGATLSKTAYSALYNKIGISEGITFNIVSNYQNSILNSPYQDNGVDYSLYGIFANKAILSTCWNYNGSNRYGWAKLIAISLADGSSTPIHSVGSARVDGSNRLSHYIGYAQAENEIYSIARYQNTLGSDIYSFKSLNQNFEENFSFETSNSISIFGVVDNLVYYIDSTNNQMFHQTEQGMNSFTSCSFSSSNLNGCPVKYGNYIYYLRNSKVYKIPLGFTNSTQEELVIDGTFSKLFIVNGKLYCYTSNKVHIIDSNNNISIKNIIGTWAANMVLIDNVIYSGAAGSVFASTDGIKWSNGDLIRTKPSGASDYWTDQCAVGLYNSKPYAFNFCGISNTSTYNGNDSYCVSAIQDFFKIPNINIYSYIRSEV